MLVTFYRSTVLPSPYGVAFINCANFSPLILWYYFLQNYFLSLLERTPAVLLPTLLLQISQFAARMSSTLSSLLCNTSIYLFIPLPLLHQKILLSVKASS